jgi:hypothetical protein
LKAEEQEQARKASVVVADNVEDIGQFIVGQVRR